MAQMNKVTQQNASSSEELAATAEEMSAQTAQLQELMQFFTVQGGSGPSIRRSGRSEVGSAARMPKQTRTSPADRSRVDDAMFDRF
jgi:methyl-accepting chemotaxis protein